ncbi:hypothetical protein TW83_14610 [Paracoccus sp. S4493]|uniref:hypothetical protein n=1 Tax=Paracoccus sp. S4493 TaxID=579490 RepID=UPI0005FA3D2B|nr:hypothetical protein [Paracoccus sp. S4493]KJZ30432.1 hypothetical protein TW83_14610 [Paracoccus sp. S4493]
MNVDLIIERFGLVGLCLVGMGFAVLILWKRLSEVSDARTADAERNADQLVKLTDEVKGAMRDASVGMDRLTEVIKDRRDG